MLKLEDVQKLFGGPFHHALVAAKELLKLVAAEEPQCADGEHPAAVPHMTRGNRH